MYCPSRVERQVRQFAIAAEKSFGQPAEADDALAMCVQANFT